MPDRQRIINELRRYHEWHIHAGWQETPLTDACKDGADLLEDDWERIKVLENTIQELNRQLEDVNKHDNQEMAKPRRSRRIRTESPSGDA